MPDLYDRATELEERQRAAALANQAAKISSGISATECQECGEPIPEARRQAVKGCRHCIDCQQEIEQYGKTHFTAR